MRAAAGWRARCAAGIAAAALAACGGGGSDAPPPAPPLLPLPANPVSLASPVAPGCNGGNSGGSFYVNAEVEPFVAIAANNPQHLVATWQQDRWTDGGSRALMTAASFDGGATWTRVLQPMSVCGGGGAFGRASDPWVDIGPDGTVYMMGLAFSGTAGSASTNAMLASRSTDGGLTWSAPATLIADGAGFFNDKNSLTADPTDARFVYAVWDRLVSTGGGPTILARSIDAGLTWQAARSIYDPGTTSQTLGNRIVVIADGPSRGMLVNVFTQIDVVAGVARNSLAVIRSADQGLTWSAPVRIADLLAVGARDADDGTPVRDGALLPTLTAGPGGLLWVAWQDGRFSGGSRDAIAVSRSADAGLTWSAPVAVNRRGDVAAFLPTLAARGDGTIGLLHYDLRPDTSGALLAGAWLLTTRDGTSWTETTVWSPFDLGGAPRVDAGLFLGDYQGLVASATSFLPLLVLSSSDTANRSDVFLLRFGGLAAAQPYRARQSLAAPPFDEAALRQRVHENTVRQMERRLPGWSRRMGVAGPTSPKAN